MQNDDEEVLQQQGEAQDSARLISNPNPGKGNTGTETTPPSPAPAPTPDPGAHPDANRVVGYK
jgi:hypothetical protein